MHAHRHTTHAFRSSVTQLWLGPQATEQHASLSISTAPRRPLKPNFQTYLVCQEPFLVVTKTWVWWSYLRNLQSHNLFVARRDSCQTKIHEKRFHGNIFCGPPYPSTLPKSCFLGGVQSWSLYSENCRENVDATLEKKFRNLNEKMWPQASKKVPRFERENVTTEKWPEKWPRSSRENASNAVKQQENIERGGALAFLTILSPRWLRENVFWARPIFSTISQFENGPPFSFFRRFPRTVFFGAGKRGPKILTCFRIPMWEEWLSKSENNVFSTLLLLIVEAPATVAQTSSYSALLSGNEALTHYVHLIALRTSGHKTLN